MNYTAQDENGHKINFRGELIHDKECGYCTDRLYKYK